MAAAAAAAEGQSVWPALAAAAASASSRAAPMAGARPSLLRACGRLRSSLPSSMSGLNCSIACLQSTARSTGASPPMPCRTSQPQRNGRATLHHRRRSIVRTLRLIDRSAFLLRAGDDGLLYAHCMSCPDCTATRVVGSHRVFLH
eukprot:6188009-Pleurochrysis_carterae.AAC.4